MYLSHGVLLESRLQWLQSLRLWFPAGFRLVSDAPQASTDGWYWVFIFIVCNYTNGFFFWMCRRWPGNETLVKSERTAEQPVKCCQNSAVPSPLRLTRFHRLAEQTSGSNGDAYQIRQSFFVVFTIDIVYGSHSHVLRHCPIAGFDGSMQLRLWLFAAAAASIVVLTYQFITYLLHL